MRKVGIEIRKTVDADFRKRMRKTGVCVKKKYWMRIRKIRRYSRKKEKF